MTVAILLGMRMFRGLWILSLLGGAWCCGGVASRDEKGAGDDGSGDECTPNAVTIASEQPASTTSKIAIDDVDAYWTYGIMIADAPPASIGAVTRAPLAGGAAPTAVASQQLVPTAIALNANDVFWIDQYTRKIMKASKSGGAPTEVVSGFNGPFWDLEADDDSVYFLDYRGGGLGVFKAPVGGGDVIQLATGEGQLQALALDDTHVYWADHVLETGQNRVMKVSTDGGAPSVLYSRLFGNTDLEGLAVGPSAVYWNGDYGEGVGPDGRVSIKLMQIPLAGGAPVAIAEESGIRHVAVNSRSVYWTVELLDGSAGAIRKVPLNGGTVSTVVSDQLGLSAIAVDDASVCWLNFVSGTNTGEVMCLETCESGE